MNQTLISGFLLILAQLYTGMAFHVGESVEMRLFAIPVLMLSLVPLLLALVLETESRPHLAGMVLMLSAAGGVIITLLILLVTDNHDGQSPFDPRRQINLSAWGLFVMSLPMAVAGWLLRKAG